MAEENIVALFKECRDKDDSLQMLGVYVNPYVVTVSVFINKIYFVNEMFNRFRSVPYKVEKRRAWDSWNSCTVFVYHLFYD